MPWTAADAKKHKAGLSPRQASAWAKIANSALADCEAKNGSDCEGRAIRIANAAVDKVGKEVDLEQLALVIEAPIAKADDSCQRIFGWASIAVRKDGRQVVDLQGDAIDIEDLEEAFYDYVVESGELNFSHAGSCRGQLIEAMVFTPEKIAALDLPPDSLPLGAWVGFHIPDGDDYAEVKKQGFFMFSIEGTGVREPY